MKLIFLISLWLLLTVSGFSQTKREGKNVAFNLDTIQYVKANIRCADPEYYLKAIKTRPIKDGYNVLVDSTGVIVSEGYSKNERRIGFWRDYEGGQLILITKYDRKGIPQNRINFDADGIIEIKR